MLLQGLRYLAVFCYILYSVCVLGQQKCRQANVTAVSADIESFVVMAHVHDVKTPSSCVELCVLEAPRCIAASLDSLGKCSLYDRNLHLESHSDKPLTTVYLMRDSGGCPSEFIESYGMSRYLLVTEKANWKTAIEGCERKRSKLAELTSRAEIEWFIGNIKKGKGGRVGGIQSPDAKRPSEGWRWYRSGQAFKEFWRTGEPSNGYTGGEGTIMIFNTGFNDVPEQDLIPYYCECISLL